MVHGGVACRLIIGLRGDPHDERAQRLGQHVHLRQLELDDMVVDEVARLPPSRPGVPRRHLDRGLAHPQRVRRELEVAERRGSRAAQVESAVHLAHHVGVGHAGVLEDQLRVLVEAPAALVEHLAHPHAGRIDRHQELGGALFLADVRVGPRAHKKHLRHAAVRNEALLPVEDPLVALALRLEFPAGLGIVLGRQTMVRSGIGLGAGVAQQKSIVRQERLQEALLLIRGAARRDHVAPLPALAEGLGDRAVGFGELRHHQGLRHEVDPVPAPLPGDRRRAEAELRALPDDVPVEGRARVGNPVARE